MKHSPEKYHENHHVLDPHKKTKSSRKVWPFLEQKKQQKLYQIAQHSRTKWHSRWRLSSFFLVFFSPNFLFLPLTSFPHQCAPWLLHAKWTTPQIIKLNVKFMGATSLTGQKFQQCLGCIVVRFHNCSMYRCFVFNIYTLIVPHPWVNVAWGQTFL